MTLMRITLSISVAVVLALSVYLLIALPLLQDTDERAAPVERGSARPDPAVESAAAAPPAAPEAGAAASAPVAASTSGSRRIEIYGRLSDTDGKPVEDALITEERYFFSTRSDASGAYRLPLELPYHRLPTLDFLRAGFRGERIELTQSQLQRGPSYRLDVTLEDSTDTLRVPGWVANDLGVALEGVRIEISAVQPESDRNFYLTVFSDERGNFTLEGVRADSRYKLTAMMAPEYPIYRDPDFYLGTDPKPIQIVLKTLKFVDLGGMILTPDATPVANFEIYIKNVSTGVHTGKIVSDSSGFFTLEGFPLGEVDLSTRGADFHRITGLELNESNYSNLELTVDHGELYLDGWVSDANGYPIENAMVTLEASTADSGIEYQSYRSRGTDESGKFSFANIAGGEHRISVFANGFDKLETSLPLERQSGPIRLTLTPTEPR